MFVILEDFHHRPGISADMVAMELRKKTFAEIIEAQVSVFGAPPVDGLGSAGSFKLMVEDRSDMGLAALQERADQLSVTGMAQPGIAGMFNSLRASTPQLFIDVDRTKCKIMGVPLSDVFQALQVFLGGDYVNDFNQFGRTWQVNLQADAAFRVDAEHVRSLKVRNSRGEMVPLGTLAKIEDVGGPFIITRYNMYPAATINGGTFPGVSSGQMIASIDKAAKEELGEGLA